MLAERLNRDCAIEVREAREGDRVRAGTALIAPAGHHMVLRSTADGVEAHLIETEDNPSWYRPSVDMLLASVACVYRRKALGIVMTGMGNDGSAGAAMLKREHAEVWAQDQATCAVWGMPRAIVEAGLADRVVPLGQMARELCLQAAASLGKARVAKHA